MQTKVFFNCAVFLAVMLTVIPLRAAELRWTYVEGAVAYRVEVRRETGANIFRKDVATLSVDLDLEPGNYSVRVSPLNKFGRVDIWGDWTPLTIQARKKSGLPQPDIQRFEPNEIIMDAGNKFVLYGKNFPKGAQARLENTNGARIPLKIEKQESDRITVSLPKGVFQQGAYTVVLTDTNGDQYRKGGLTLVQHEPPEQPVQYIANDSFYMGMAGRLLTPTMDGWDNTSSSWFAWDLFLGVFLPKGFAAELTFNAYEPFVGHDNAYGYTSADVDSDHGYRSKIITGADISVSWTPNFNFPINPVAAVNFGFFHVTDSRTQLTSNDSSGSIIHTGIKMGVSLLARFDVTRDFFIDLGYRVENFPYFTPPIEDSGGTDTRSLTVHSVLARIAMTFGDFSAEKARQPERSSRAGFGDIGVGFSISAPSLKSNIMENSHGGKITSGGLFLSFWLREGLQLELHYEHSEVFIDSETFFDSGSGYFKSQSLAFDAAWSPEYAFFIKPLLSMGLGVYSSSFKHFQTATGGDTSTAVSRNLGVRWALMLRAEIWRFLLDVGIRSHLIDTQGAEFRLVEPIARLSYRF